MSVFDQILAAIRDTESYGDKSQLIEYLHRAISQVRGRVDREDQETLAAFALSETAALPAVIESIERSAERDAVCNYADGVLGVLMYVCASPADLSDEERASVEVLFEILRRERFMEEAVNEVFQDGGIPTEADMDRLLCVVAPLKDEYRKGKFFSGILHYRAQVGKMGADAKAVLARYTASELRRYLSMPDFDPDVRDALEVIADAAADYLTDELAALLSELLSRVDTAVQYYAAATLLRGGKPVSDEVIHALACDLEYADMLYTVLKKNGQVARFPAELSTEEYLAKSNMVHWLLYPTELGQVPDEIEYLGRVKKGFFKGEIYHIFRFRSTSDTLDDAQKGRWLIGWANDDGGTFSNFDLYDDYAGKNVAETLKNIKRKLL